MEQSEEDQHVQIISPFNRAHEEEKKEEEKNLQVDPEVEGITRILDPGVSAEEGASASYSQPG
jgi:uncharacterized protein (DUF58 family)